MTISTNRNDIFVSCVIYSGCWVLGHAAISLSTRFCPYLTRYTKYVTKPTRSPDSSSDSDDSNSNQDDSDEDELAKPTRRKPSWDTIRNLKPTSATSNSTSTGGKVEEDPSKSMRFSGTNRRRRAYNLDRKDQNNANSSAQPTAAENIALISTESEAINNDVCSDQQTINQELENAKENPSESVMTTSITGESLNITTNGTNIMTESGWGTVTMNN